MNRSFRTIAAGISAALVLAACSTLDIGQAPKMGKQDVIAVLPLANYTETPEAGHRAASIAFGLLQVGRQGHVIRDINQSRSDPLLGDATAPSLATALQWAQQADARYALTGSVQEWRYKVGVDGEPAVGLSFNLIDLSSGKTVWSATGSKSGWSRSSLAGIAQELESAMLEPLRTSGR